MWLTEDEVAVVVDDTEQLMVMNNTFLESVAGDYLQTECAMIALLLVREERGLLYRQIGFGVGVRLRHLALASSGRFRMVDSHLVNGSAVAVVAALRLGLLRLQRYGSFINGCPCARRPSRIVSPALKTSSSTVLAY